MEPVTNPFGLGNVGGLASPNLADIDGDGDLDALIGNNGGDTVVYRNVGTAAAPSFTLVGTNAFFLSNIYQGFYIGSASAPAFGDLDGDGSLEAIIGNADGNVMLYGQKPGAPTGLELVEPTTGTPVGTPTNILDLAVAGSAVAAAMVVLYDGARALGTATASAAGSWSTTSALLADVAHALTATVTDAVGNASPNATALTVTINTAAPSVAILSSALTKVAEPTLAGKAEANSAVTVSVAGATYITAADAGGGWSVNLATVNPASGTLALNTNGSNAVSDTARDAAGNVSAPATQALIIDTSTPGVTITLGSTMLGRDQTTTVTFAFTEVPTGFLLDDITVPDGTLSNLVLVPGSDGLVYTATQTPVTDVVADNIRITLGTGWSDAVGNAPAATVSSPAYSIDTRYTSGAGAPVLGGAVSSQTVNDNGTLQPFAGITLTDGNADQTQTVVIKLRDAANIVSDATGGFTVASLAASGFTRTAPGTYTLTAANAAVAQTALGRRHGLRRPPARRPPAPAAA